MSQSLKNLVRSSAWSEVEKMFNKEIEDLKDCSQVPGGLPDKTYSREVRARVVASSTLKALLSKIKLGGTVIQDTAPKRMR